MFADCFSLCYLRIGLCQTFRTQFLHMQKTFLPYKTGQSSDTGTNSSFYQLQMQPLHLIFVVSRMFVQYHFDCWQTYFVLCFPILLILVPEAIDRYADFPGTRQMIFNSHMPLFWSTKTYCSRALPSFGSLQKTECLLEDSQKLVYFNQILLYIILYLLSIVMWRKFLTRKCARHNRRAHC